METKNHPLENEGQNDVTQYNLRGLMGFLDTLVKMSTEDHDVLPGMNPDRLTDEIVTRIPTLSELQFEFVKRRFQITTVQMTAISFEWAKRMKRIKDAIKTRLDQSASICCT